MINSIHWYNRSRVRMINKIVHSEIKHAALKLRERESSFDLDSWITLDSLNNRSEQPSTKITGADAPTELESCGQGKTTQSNLEIQKTDQERDTGLTKFHSEKICVLKIGSEGTLSDSNMKSSSLSFKQLRLDSWKFPVQEKSGKCKAFMYRKQI